MLRNIIIVVGLLIAGLLVYASTLPDSFEVRRSISVNATAAQVFSNINDFRRWQAWSPWEKRDPKMLRDFSGAETGIGATYAWAGNADVGKGRMEIVAVAIPVSITILLDFSEPFAARNTAEFTLDSQADKTDVTWIMRGTYSKPAKLMSLFFDMDSMVGADFEQGLANLKALAETQAAADQAAHSAP